MTYRFAFSITSLLLSATAPALAQSRGPDTGTLVIAIPRDAAYPIPTLWAGENTSREASDMMFLRLADFGPQIITSDESKFVPQLARRWTRPDSLTLVFELDPRARWHDGKPVVANDVIYALERARNPKYGGGSTAQLRHIASVTADGDSRVVVRFRQAYAEQLYDVVYHVPPLPSHLLAGINPDSLRTSAFASQPVGNGPYRFVGRVPGQRIELAANPDFFLGKPRIERVVMLVVTSADARANMLRAGEIDALDNAFSLPDPAQVNALPDYHYYPSPGGGIAYITFNQRNPSDTSQPHPILADRTVRRALVLAIDRERLAQSGLGPYTHAPGAPASPLVARAAAPPAPLPYNVQEAKRLLASRGWKDTNGDGTLDRYGTSLSLVLMVPNTSAYRRVMAAQIQEAYRQIGVQVDLQVLEPGVYGPRRAAGAFDIEFWAANQDPTPTGLVTSWTCTSEAFFNPGHYCNPIVDSLIAAGTASRKPVPGVWREVMKRISDDIPAMFVAGIVGYNPVHKRFQNVSLRPQSLWSDVWKWSVKPGAQLERDRQ